METRQVITTFPKFMDYVHLRNVYKIHYRVYSKQLLFSPTPYTVYFKWLLMSGSSVISLLTELLTDLSLQLFRVMEKRQDPLRHSAVSYVLTHLNAKEAGQQPKDQQAWSRERQHPRLPCLLFHMGLSGWMRQWGQSDLEIEDGLVCWSARIQDDWYPASSFLWTRF